MENLTWFLDEPQEVARLPHFTYTEKALTLVHEGLNADQVALLRGVVFPGLPYRAQNPWGPGTDRVALYCPDPDFKWTGRNREPTRSWHDKRRALFSYYTARNDLFERHGIHGRLMTRAVKRRHLVMLCDFDGGVGDAVAA